MHFGYAIIYVSDVEATLSFYENAFNFKRHFIHESKQYGELATGETKLAFACESLSESNGVLFVNNRADSAKAAGFELAFVTEHVLEAYEHAVDSGALAIKKPIEKPWGQLVAYVRDLNGIIIEICSPMNG